MSYFAVVSSLVMMVFGGIGVDMVVTELNRTKVQNTLDRAVLAAADLDQTLEPEEVVTDYMTKMGLSDALVSSDVDEGLNYRIVTADGFVQMPSNFLQLLGIDTISASGHAQATERFNKVEVSLVVDISGSMADNSKMDNLKSAASDFVDTLLADGNDDLVSISLVPYSEQVNAGPDILSKLSVDWKHGYSHCLEMPESVFSSAALDTSMTYEQMQHFQWNYDGKNTLTDTVCPRYDYERIAPFSQDASALKQQINKLTPRAGTSIFLGMKWGSALLDPSTREIASSLIDEGEVSSAFEGRPLDYDDEEVLKTVVLMTDGQHDKSFRISSNYYDSESEYVQWSKNNLWYWLNRNVYSWQRGYFYYQKYDADTGDRLLDSICTAAKDKGIIIWSIGFEVQDHGADVMESCASSPSHFFRVDGTEISEAFSTIAHTLNQLRLTQ
ncbi:TadE/TadG family type IV pilus assembly protein [Alloyangia pacifica]|uniref:TadE/TadG family type IV pilus assembly protein n=1 Tax=Alloyangia pacifica TaxID=311180 RepID=UPI001CFE53F3|nr:TadE/TadG family type IV pilus assembly protein [Alloyangia pacifica]